MKSKFLLLTILFFLSIIAYSQNTWTQKPNVGGTARTQAASFSIGTKGYIVCGRTGTSTYTNELWEYDQMNNIWTQKTSYPGAAKVTLAAFSIGNKGYVGTGYDGTTQTKDFWEYNSSTNTWLQVADFGGGKIQNAAGFSIGSKGYVVGGLDSCCVLNKLWEYNPSNNQWVQKANFGGAARDLLVGFSIGSKGYAGTGRLSGGAYTDDFWQYDPVANTWTQKANYAGGIRGAAVGFSINGKGFIGTGSASAGTSLQNDFWEYDTLANAWTSTANFVGIVRWFASGFSIGSKGYIGIGTGSGATYFQDFFEYCSAFGNISGAVTANTIGNINGYVYLYFADSLGRRVPADSTQLTGGNYIFNNVQPNNYKILVKPDTAIYHTSVLKTYYGDKFLWDLATVVNAACGNNYTANILANYLPSQPVNTAQISGRVLADASYTGKIAVQGDPIPGVDVALEQNPGSVMSSTQTDTSGNFTFTNVPIGNYNILTTIAGFTTVDAHTISIQNDSNVINNMDYQVSDSTIYLVDINTGINNKKDLDNNLIIVYPNPTENNIYLKVQNENDLPLKFNLYNVFGELVESKNIVSNNQLIEISKMRSGIYSYRIIGSKIKNLHGVLIKNNQ